MIHISDGDTSPYAVKVSPDKYGLWKHRRPLLSHISIELTERCNNNCIHCYINLPKNDPARSRELSTGEIKKVLDECASLGCMGVMYTGGEPLLRKDFEELYLYARRSGMTVSVRTNATLITPHLARVFARTPPGTPIVITVYGMSKDSYEAVTRTSGSFEAFRKGLELLIENKVPFELSSIVLPPNKHDIDSFESWLSALPAENRIPSYSLIIDPRAREDEDKNANLRGLRLTPEELLTVRKRRGDKYSREMAVFCQKFTSPPGDLLLSCGSCVESCSLDAYGNLQPCLQLRHPDVLYTIKTGSVKDAMTRFFPEVRKLRAKNKDYLARCANCFLKGLCEQCPAKSWMEHGTLDMPVDYLCEVAHVQAIDLGLLRVGEKAWEVKDWRERINSLSMSK